MPFAVRGGIERWGDVFHIIWEFFTKDRIDFNKSFECFEHLPALRGAGAHVEAVHLEDERGVDIILTPLRAQYIYRYVDLRVLSLFSLFMIRRNVVVVETCVPTAKSLLGPLGHNA